MVEYVFGALFGVTLAGMVAAVIAGVGLLAWPATGTSRRAVTPREMTAHH